MIKTFQSYLIFWYSLILSFTVIVFSVLLYLSISNYLHNAIDHSLLNLASIEAGAALEIESPSDHDSETPHIHGNPLNNNLKERYGITDRFVRIFTHDGKRLDSYSSSDRSLMPTDNDILRSIKRDEHYYETIIAEGSPLRVLYLPIVQNGEITHIIQVGIYITYIVNIQRRLKTTLFFLNMLIITISFITSYFLANRAVYPINVISSTAVEINEKSLNKRLVFNSPFKEVKQLVDIFNAMLNRIESSFEAKKQFIANASHEMQSPLTAIKGSMEVALRRERPVQEYISVIKSSLEETDRLSHLLKDLLTLSMNDDKNVLLDFTDFSLDSLIKEAVDVKRKQAVKKKIILEYSYNKQIYVRGAIEMIRQLLYNLLDNAIKYTLPSGKIKISTYIKDNYAFIEVKDNGAGISEKDLSRIFDRFFRVDRSRSRDTGGAGLGLAIVKDIAHIHKGEIYVESKAGAGSIFTFMFPCCL